MKKLTYKELKKELKIYSEADFVRKLELGYDIYNKKNEISIKKTNTATNNIAYLLIEDLELDVYIDKNGIIIYYDVDKDDFFNITHLMDGVRG